MSKLCKLYFKLRLNFAPFYPLYKINNSLTLLFLNKRSNGNLKTFYLTLNHPHPRICPLQRRPFFCQPFFLLDKHFEFNIQSEKSRFSITCSFFGILNYEFLCFLSVCGGVPVLPRGISKILSVCWALCYFDTVDSLILFPKLWVEGVKVGLLFLF